MDHTKFDGIRVYDQLYPATRRKQGFYVRTYTKPRAALAFLVDALSAGDVDVQFDGKRYPIKRHRNEGLEPHAHFYMAHLASNDERMLLNAFGVTLDFPEPK